jgi:hypothetical protein
MQVRDNHDDHGNSDATDAIYLAMAGVTTSSACPAGMADCAASGTALKNELQLSVDVSDTENGRPVEHWSGGVAELEKRVKLRSGLSHGDEFWVRMTAALPFDPTGNEVQYGGLGFTLQLGLAGVAGESTHVIGPHGGKGHGSKGGGGHGVGGLAVTGTPVETLAGVAAALLAVGLVLVFAARRRGRGGGVADSQL